MSVQDFNDAKKDMENMIWRLDTISAGFDAVCLYDLSTQIGLIVEQLDKDLKKMIAAFNTSLDDGLKSAKIASATVLSGLGLVEK